TDDTIPLDVTAQTRCIAGKAYVAVTAVNDDTASAAVTITTPYGTKAFPEILPGKTAYQSFNTRAASIQAGTVTVTATRDGQTSNYQAPYTAATCS
ncbi:hypothetical protein AB1484_33380, partial [Parafrankia sp. FMc6]|uniref:hypothetical protein n=1 Tax=Parafrankia soli TaxID=2599596 RepID=UPI0034D39F7D